MVKLFGLGLVLILLSACGQPPRDYLQPDSSKSRSAHSSAADRRCDASVYTVVRNDTLSEIALRCGLSMNQIIVANNLRSPYIIYPNQELIIPRNHAGLSSANQAAHRVNWIWPVEDYTAYDYVLDSQGVQALEVFSEVGSLVRAAADGEVAFAEMSTGPLGNMIMLRHADNYLTIYAHNQRLQVKQGDRVKAGEIIANLGQSGHTDRPKLYFELRHQGRKIAIEPFLGRP